MKTKLLTTLIMLAAASLMAAPLSDIISGPTNGIGSYRITGGGHNCTATVRYSVAYNSSFGGHWNLSGTHTEPCGTQLDFEDSFSGTISDMTINGTFTSANFSWEGDVWMFCLPPIGRQVLSYDFSITINHGRVTGTAHYH